MAATGTDRAGVTTAMAHTNPTGTVQSITAATGTDREEETTGMAHTNPTETDRMITAVIGTDKAEAMIVMVLPNQTVTKAHQMATPTGNLTAVATVKVATDNHLTLITASLQTKTVAATVTITGNRAVVETVVMTTGVTCQTVCTLAEIALKTAVCNLQEIKQEVEL